MIGRIWRFVLEDNAATAIEYALMGGMIALAIMTIPGGIGWRLSTYFSEVSSSFK
jgi:Flp pilus assembly pilin Flp